MRKAKVGDFKIGTILMCPEQACNYTITKNLNKGMWQCRSDNGCISISEKNANDYFLFKLNKTNIEFNVNQKQIDIVVKDIWDKNFPLEGSECCVVVATRYDHNRSEKLCYGFFFGNLDENYIGQIIDNKDGSVSRVEKLIT